MFSIDKSLNSILGKKRGKPNNLFNFNSKVLKNFMGDRDRDGVINLMDCQPNNYFKQGVIHNNFAYVYHGTKPQNVEQIKKTGLTPQPSYWGSSYTFLTPSKKTAQKYGSVLEVKVPLSNLAGHSRQAILDEKHPFYQIKYPYPIPASDIKVVTNGTLTKDKKVPKNGTAIKEVPKIGRMNYGKYLQFPRPIHYGKYLGRKRALDVEQNLMGDRDGDGVINALDCDPNDPNKQGVEPNVLMRKQIQKTPIFFVEKRHPDDNEISIKHILASKAPGAKQARQYIFQAVKQHPGVLRDIKEKKAEVIMYPKQYWKSPEFAARAEPVFDESGQYQSTMVTVKIPEQGEIHQKGTRARTLFHELKHAEQQSKITAEEHRRLEPIIGKLSGKEYYKQQPAEKEAEVYAYGKVAETRTTPGAIIQYKKYISEELAGHPEEAKKEYEKGKVIFKEEKKEREEALYQAYRKMFADEDKDGTIAFADNDDNNPNNPSGAHYKEAIIPAEGMTWEQYWAKKREKEESKERKKKYFRDYQKERFKRPEIKAQRREYKLRPEVKAKAREYYQRPEVRARVKEYREQPEVKAKVKEQRREYLHSPEGKEVRSLSEGKYRKTPQYKEYQKKYKQRPEVREKTKVYYSKYQKEYRKKPEVQEKIKEYSQRPEVKEKAKKWREANMKDAVEEFMENE